MEAKTVTATKYPAFERYSQPIKQ
jgi:radial spoke head protein 4A